MSKAPRTRPGPTTIAGAHAVLGMDMVAFSTLHDDDQVRAIEYLMRWINESLAFHSIRDTDYRWSPAGDGGYLTFATDTASRKAIDVAFSICKKITRPDWVPRNGEKIRLRFGLHAGTVQEGQELGRLTNIWGLGINTAARIVSVAAPLQILVSKQYHDTYIKDQRKGEFQFDKEYWRTVKHGVQLEIMNVSSEGLGLSGPDASAQRWQSIGGLWNRMLTEYKFLVDDAMNSDDPIAALAAGKFLLDLNTPGPVQDLCETISKTEQPRPARTFKPQSHEIFSAMPPKMLMQVLQEARPRRLKAGEDICKRGDLATSCFFPVSGAILVDLPGREEPIQIPLGAIVGEFSLWIPNLPRTGTVRAASDGLILEIDTARLKDVLTGAPHVAEVVYGIVKQRILENVLKSKDLFPGLAASTARIPATCDKYEQGTRLDLASSTYVLFSGRVDLELPDPPSLQIRADGERLQVAGIASDIGMPDGASATVLDESVAVVISHDTLRGLQSQFEHVAHVWNGICGQRQGQLRRLRAG